MRKILFTIGCLDSGGVSKSLINLLDTIDKETYEISLFVANPNGVMTKHVPSNVKVLVNDIISYLVSGTLGLIPLLRKGYLYLFFASIVRILLSRFNRGKAGLLLSRLMPRFINETYDLIVDYNGQHMLYYMVDKLYSRKKISFFHSDYFQWSHYENVDKIYYPKIDGIYSISTTCVENLKKKFPQCSDKIFLMENLILKDKIVMLSKVSQNIMNREEVNFVTLGHVCLNKGSKLAIEVARFLKHRGFKFKWFFIGKVSDEFDFVSYAKDMDVEENVVFLGRKDNPYPYLSAATLYVHLSKFEGKSIALDEAKLLQKPIVVTNFSSVQDQFTDRVNASICNMNVESIASAIVELLENDKLRHSYSKWLAENTNDNLKEIQKIYKWVCEN